MSELRIPKVSELAPTFGGKSAPMDKVQKFGWRQSGDVGTDQEIHKNELKIDYTYQRDTISQARIGGFCADWDWTKFGRIIVSARPNGEYYVVDGQHRVLAARNRSDIQMLPCVVHRFGSVEEEALAFKDLNVNRGPVSSYHQFKALLVGKHPKAVAVHNLLASFGYSVAQTRGKSANSRTVCCVHLIQRCCEEDQAAITAALQVAAKLVDGGHIFDDILGGLYFLQRHLQRIKMGSITDQDTVDKLITSGVGEIRKSISTSKNYHSRGGYKVCAQGIIKLLNRRKRHRIPDIMSDSE